MSNAFSDALSPLDGRYADKLSAVRRIFSEAGLMRERVRVECAWFLALRSGPAAGALGALSPPACRWLSDLAQDPRAADVPAIVDAYLEATGGEPRKRDKPVDVNAVT